MCGWNKDFCDFHHIVPKQKGGKNNIDNISILCPNCHREAGLGILQVPSVIQKYPHLHQYIQEYFGQCDYNWNKYDLFLGTMTDKKLAGIIGCSLQNVGERRRKLNINAFSKRII